MLSPNLTTRCPSCSKLFSLEGASLQRQNNSLIFECNACQAHFAVDPTEADAFEPNATEVTSRLLGETPVSPAHQEIDANLIAHELSLGAKPELILLWKRIIDDYEDEHLHEGFIEACLKTDALAYAGSKYSRILAEFPAEPLAAKMKKRIQILAAAEIDAQNLARQRARAREIAPPQPAKNPVLSLTLIAIVLGTLLVLAGLILHGQRNIFAVGVAMLALVIGVRFFYQRNSSFE